jgi:SAM-dependent methyltransferase
MINNKPTKHYVSWNNNKIKDFWEVYGALPGREGHWFIYDHVDWLIRKLHQSLDKWHPLPVSSTCVLDIGFGSGLLLIKLAHEGFKCLGVDNSAEATRALSEKLTKENLVGESIQGDGCDLPFAEGTFDCIFATQLIEHLTSEDTPKFFAEVTRCLTRGGLFISTTRWNEDLERSMCVCPDCLAIFHFEQHLQNYTEGKVIDLCQQVGLNVLQCTRCMLNEPMGLNKDTIAIMVKGVLYFFYHLIFNRGSTTNPGTHILTIAQKP